MDDAGKTHTRRPVITREAPDTWKISGDLGLLWPMPGYWRLYFCLVGPGLENQ